MSISYHKHRVTEMKYTDQSTRSKLQPDLLLSVGSGGPETGVLALFKRTLWSSLLHFEATQSQLGKS